MTAEWIIAVGGPLDGRDWPVRCPDGLVLVNKPAREVLVYDRRADRLIARQVEALDDDGAIAAATGPRWDVLAYDDETMKAWAR